ncbi:hypothetical protein GGI05_001008, partial [Coemansia sp. RSA 2603]
NLPLIGVQIGRHLKLVDATQSTKTKWGLRLIISYCRAKFELTELGDDAECMIFDAKEIDAMDIGNDNDMIVMRIIPKPTIESVFKDDIFDPSSADLDLKHIIVGWKATAKSEQAIKHIWHTFRLQITVSELDYDTFIAYKTKFISPESIDISSDEDNAVQPPSFLDKTNLDQHLRRISSGYGLRSNNHKFMGEQSSDDGPDPNDGVSSDEEDAESRSLRCKYRSLDQKCLFEYPLGGHKRISVNGSDICRLFPREFLNDTIIEFYMRYISENLQKSNPELYKQCYFFNTFFFRKLVHLRKSSTKGRKEEPEYLYEHMKKWTASAKLFERKYIFVPINENIHWYLAIITNPHLMLDNSDGSDESGGVDGDGDGGSDKDSTNTTHSVPAASISDMGGKGSSDFAGLHKDDTSVVIDDSTKDHAASDTASHSANDAIDVLSDTEVALSKNHKGNSSKDAIETSSSPMLPSAEDIIDLSSPQFNRAPNGSSKPATVSLRFKDTSVDINESKYVSSEDKPCILVLDSLGGKHQQAIPLIRNYMVGEAMSMSQSLSSDVTRGKYVKVPFQGNMCDCGVFLLNYIEEFLKMPADIVELAMNGVDLRRWFEPAQMKDKRKDILMLASKLADEYDRAKAETRQSDSASNKSKSDVEMSDPDDSGSKSDNVADAGAVRSPILSNDEDPPKTV